MQAAGAAERILLHSARAFVSPAPAPSAGAADPVRLLALARRNRMVPLLHRFLAPRPDTPPELVRALSAGAAANARAALGLARELRRLTGALEAAGIGAAAYKGPALAVRAYGDLALRTYSDVDLLVCPADVPRAAALLEEAGYRPAHDFPPHAEALFRRIDGDYPFAHGATGRLVELHCRVSSLRFGADLPTRALLARARPVALGGGAVPALADDDLFLALCLHGAKHRWARLEWLAAPAAVAVRAALPLEALLERAAALHARRAFLLAVHLMRETLGLPLPPPVAAAIRREPGLDALAAEARGLWFADGEDDATAANLGFNLRLQDDAAARARFAARWLLVPSPEDWAWVRLPEPLAPLYRVLRPLRLALRYGAGRGR